MKRTSFADWPCSVARTVDLLGDWWTPLVVREAMYGSTRFDEFERALGIGRNVLTQRPSDWSRRGCWRSAHISSGRSASTICSPRPAATCSA